MDNINAISFKQQSNEETQEEAAYLANRYKYGNILLMFNYDDSEKQILKIALLSRAFIILLALISSMFLYWDDSSGNLFLYKNLTNDHGMLERIINRLLRPFISWDAIHFTAISQWGYVFEYQHAFFPLLPISMGLLKDTSKQY